MKNKKRFLIGMLSSFMLAATVGGAVACKDDEKPQAPGYDETGIYYVDVNNEEYVLSLSGNSFTLLVNNETQTGTYKYDGDNVNFKFKDVKTPVVGDLDETDGTLTMEINGVPYRFFKKVTYSVSFVTNCDETIAPVKVTNGRKVERPADPVKEGHIFLGWYSDAAFTTAFAFDAMPVTKDTTLYALFVEDQAGQDEFTADFVVDGEVVNSVKTVNGVVVGLPTPEVTGKTFVGWWFSATNDAEKLTAKYTDQKLTGNTKLFAVWESDAPAVSVNAEGVKWTAKGVNNSYKVTIEAPNGTKVVDGESVGEEQFAYDFAAKEAGEYKVTVELNGKATTVYYANKALAQVTNVQFVDPCVLVFSAVENAEKYIIEYTCGDEGHVHGEVDNGASTYFNFANCKVPVEGITFTIKAVAGGYITSVSETYTYTRNLDAVANVAVENDTVLWDSVAGATGYIVTVNGEEVATVKGNSFSLKNFAAGEYTVAVQAVAPTYNAMDATEVAYTKTTIATPVVTVNGTKITWTNVAGATKYNVKVGETVAEVVVDTTLETQPATMTYTIPADVFVEGVEDYEVSVQAIAAEEANNSAYSTAVTIRKATMSALTYNAGTVSWAPVADASQYRIKVNGANEYIVNSDSTSFDPVLTKAGENTVAVCAMFASGSLSEEVEVTVFAYEINFEVDVAGVATPTTIYKASGDKLTLPVLKKDKYTFEGWYNLPGGSANNAKKYDEEFFNANGNMTLFAGWINNNKYTVKLVYGTDEDGNELYTTGNVNYGEEFKLRIPETIDAAKGFLGWYTGVNGGGQKMSAEDGVGIGYWPNENNDTVLYAYWADVLEFKDVKDNAGKSVLSVKAGKDIGLVKEVTIPAYYNGKQVWQVASGAFLNCSGLYVINIPDTIGDISIPVDGGNGTGSAFQGCYTLEAVNVYCPNESQHNKHEAIYSTQNGMLVKTVDGISEIRYVPAGITGTLEIPYGVNLIPVNGLKYGDFEKVIIPASVTQIAKSAFANCALLKEVVFADVPEGEPVQSLEIAELAFTSCDNLTKITFPSRLASIATDSFKYSEMVTEFVVDGEDGVYTSVDGVLLMDNGSTLALTPNGLKSNTYDKDGKLVEGVFTIPDGVTKIAANAFYLSDLQGVIIPAFVTEIEAEAFNYATELKTVEFVEGGSLALKIGSKAFANVRAVETVTLPKRLVETGTEIFYQSSRLSKVVINMAKPGGDPDLGYAGLPDGAFAYNMKNNNYYVREIVVGKDTGPFSVTGVFGSSVKKVQVTEGNQFFSTDARDVLFDKDQKEVLWAPSTLDGEYELPSTVETIGANLFKGNKYLTKVIFPATISNIGANAFEGCYNITEIEFKPKAETTEVKDTPKLIIGQSAFSGLAFTQITIPERSDVEIHGYAFGNNKALTSVYVPTTVSVIGGSVTDETTQRATYLSPFDGCTEFTSFTIGADNVGNAKFKMIDGMLFGFDENGVKTTLYFAPAKGAVGDEGKVEVPKTITTISDRAFYNNATLKEITFEVGGAGLYVGSEAFCNVLALEKVEFPKGMTAIGANMFAGNPALKSIFIPNTVEMIGESFAIDCDALTDIIFEPADETNNKPLVINTVNTTAQSYRIQKNFLNGCDALETLNLSDRLAVLPYFFVIDCKALTTVNIPLSVTSIEYEKGYNSSMAMGLFDGCSALTTVNFALDKDGKTPLTEIPMYAFANCGPLRITIPEGITKIDEYAFSGSTFGGNVSNIKYVKLPTTLETIASRAFYQHSLEQVEWANAAESKITMIDTYAFYSSTGKSTMESFDIPASLEQLGHFEPSAFEGMGEPWESMFPASYDGFVFEYLTNLKQINFLTDEDGKSNLWQIGDQTFYNTGITSIKFPETRQELKLGSNLFSGCTALKKVEISSTVAKITNVFNNCLWIDEFVVAPTNTNFKVTGKTITDTKGEVIYHTFGEFSDKTYTVNYNLGDNALRGQPFEKIIVKAGVTSLGERAFAGNPFLKEVVFEEGCNIATFGKYLFQNCPNLEKVTFASTMETLGDYMFQNCGNLKEINLPANLKKIGTYAFYGTGISSITVPAGVTEIPNYAFYHCESLNSITFQATNLSKLGNYAFAYTAFETFEIPSSVSSLGTYLFSNCLNLTTVTGIPSTLTSIPAGLFSYCEKITSFTIPEKVKTIGESAFRATSISEITIPKGVTSLPNYCFQDCAKLTTVNVLGQVTSVGNYAFKNCTLVTGVKLADEKVSNFGTEAFRNSGIKEITINATATVKWGNYAFADCFNLEKVYISDNVTQFGPTSSNVYAPTFMNCPKLKTMALILTGGVIYEEEDTILLPTAMAYAGKGTFENSGIERVIIPAVMTFIGSSKSSGTGESYLFKNCKELKEVVLHDGVQRLADGVFYGCSALETIDWPASLNRIGKETFYGSGLREVSINADITSIGDAAFAYCENLTKIDVNSGSVYFSSKDGVLYNYDGDKLLVYPAAKVPANGTIEIPANVSLGAFAFAGNTNVTNVTIPATMTSVPAAAFDGCTNLATVTFAADSAVESIGAYAFRGTAISEISLPASVKSFGTTLKLMIIGSSTYSMKDTFCGQSFADCVNLTAIEIPAAVKDLPMETFAGCTNLSAVTFATGSEIEAIGGDVFKGTAITSFEVPATVKTLGTTTYVNYVYEYYGAFEGLKNLTSVTFAEGSVLESLGDNTFVGTGITAITLPDSVTYIGVESFKGTGITAITLPESLEEIGASAFVGTGITSIVIPANVTVIGDNAFEGLVNLTSVTFAEGSKLDEIGDYAFSGTGITSIVLPETLTDIGKYAFADCAALQTINIPEAVAYIREGAFSGCTAIAEITLPYYVDLYAANIFAGWDAETQKINVVANKWLANMQWNIGWEGDFDITKVTFSYVESQE